MARARKTYYPVTLPWASAAGVYIGATTIVLDNFNIGALPATPFYLSLPSGEIVQVTNVSGLNLTVVRAQLGTSELGQDYPFLRHVISEDFIIPAGVTSVHVDIMGSGGGGERGLDGTIGIGGRGGGGGGGAIMLSVDVPTVPGDTWKVRAGGGGHGRILAAGLNIGPTNGLDSFFAHSGGNQAVVATGAGIGFNNLGGMHVRGPNVGVQFPGSGANAGFGGTNNPGLTSDLPFSNYGGTTATAGAVGVGGANPNGANGGGGGGPGGQSTWAHADGIATSSRGGDGGTGGLDNSNGGNGATPLGYGGGGGGGGGGGYFLGVFAGGQGYSGGPGAVVLSW